MKPIPPSVPQRRNWGDYLQTLMILAMTIGAAVAIANLLPIEFNLLLEPLKTDEINQVSRSADIPLAPAPALVASNPLSDTNVLPGPLMAEKILTNSNTVQTDDGSPSKLKVKKQKRVKHLGVNILKKRELAVKPKYRRSFQR